MQAFVMVLLEFSMLKRLSYGAELLPLLIFHIMSSLLYTHLLLQLIRPSQTNFLLGLQMGV
jgi:hypothetical protein